MAERLQSLCRGIIPTITHAMHKGQAGRVAIVGGSKYYTGAPYYAAFSALKTGADLAFVLCTESASIPIKCYSPELMVAPILPSKEHEGSLNEVEDLIKRANVFIVGPGLGRDGMTLEGCERIISQLRNENLPIIIDGDALYLLTQNPSIIRDYTRAILTPNIAELGRLLEAVFGSNYKQDKKHLSSEELLRELSAKLGNVTIIQKGEEDIIVNALVSQTLRCSIKYGSPRRCGGQGDVLAGVVGLFSHWALMAAHDGNIPQWSSETSSSQQENEIRNLMLGAYASCLLLKKSAKSSFKTHRRGSTTPNIIDELPKTFQNMFPIEEENDQL